ncbi:hypothetical protein [Cellulomonas timonensis]|uniref:hypothetical protein n=1 Tax=Cellulomonas timonensis TaxID=1689271 RepID=UPI0008368A13|nr:hypothetical protein [Cellulomonas timonensis]
MDAPAENPAAGVPWRPTASPAGPSWASTAPAAPAAPAARTAPPAVPVDAPAGAGPAWAPSGAPASVPAEEPAAPPWGALSRTTRAGAEAQPEPGASATPYASDDDDEDDEYDERPSHPYTWLQLIVLALVAFVLGFLIMLLGSKAAGGDESAAGPATTDVAAGVVAVDISPGLRVL